MGITAQTISSRLVMDHSMLICITLPCFYDLVHYFINYTLLVHGLVSLQRKTVFFNIVYNVLLINGINYYDHTELNVPAIHFVKQKLDGHQRDILLSLL